MSTNLSYQVHFFVTSNLLADYGSDSNLVPVISDLYHSALSSTTHSSSSCAQALRDAFMVAKMILNNSHPTAPNDDERTAQSTPATSQSIPQRISTSQPIVTRQVSW